jgi:hypothetical protein
MSDTIQPVDLQAPLALGEDGIPVVDGSPAIARRLVAQFGTDAADVAQRWAETTDRRGRAFGGVRRARHQTQINGFAGRRKAARLARIALAALRQECPAVPQRNSRYALSEVAP